MGFQAFIFSSITAIIAIICYKFIFKYWSYFNVNNVKFVRGLPIIGSQYRMIFGFESISEFFRNLYEKFPQEKIIGFYEIFGTPAYMLRDPELIRKITIKDFDHFTNHRFTIDVTVDSLLGRSLFFMKDQKWRDMRTTLSPAFTGSKMKLMFSLMLKCINDLNDELLLKVRQYELIYEVKDLFTRFTCDTIATCAFGIEINSLANRYNEFYQTGRSITKLDGWKGIKFMLNACVPKFISLFKWKIIDDNEANYFRQLIHRTIEYRQTNRVIRMDMINLLMQARQGLLKDSDENELKEAIDIGSVTDSIRPITINKKWEDDDVVAQTMIFLVAGLDTVATVMSFATYEIAMHPDVQNKLYEEIENVKRQLNGQPINYECIQKMSYMDMVLSETLRKWHPLPSIDRVVTKPYLLEDDTGLKVQLNVGDGVWLPTPGIQMDSNYFPNPENFNPERFNELNRTNITPFTYFPFGNGPRNCIGSRFALLECKVILFILMSTFRIETCDKTQRPLKLRKNTINIDAENGFWLKISERN